MSKKLSYKGKLPIGEQERIKLSTIDGKTGYRIIDFRIIPGRPGVDSGEYIGQRLQQAIDEYIFRQTVLPFREQQAEPVVSSSGIQVSDFGKGGRTSRGGAPNQHQKAVKAGMKALKASKYDGPKGKLRKPKLSFSKVNKTISRIKKRAKVSKKGATGVIARAVKRFT